METVLNPLQLILALNDRLFLNALEGVSDDLARERLSGHSNPFIWIATHNVWARYNILSFLGSPVRNPYQGRFENFKPYDATERYPSLEEVRAQWKKTGNLVKEAFQNVTPEHLGAEGPIKNPTGDFTNGGTITFLVQHESYTIGQMAFLKKYLTKEAMKY